MNSIQSNTGLFTRGFPRGQAGILKKNKQNVYYKTIELTVMANLNRVLLIGNLTRDPEVRYTPKGTPVADISLAINRFLQSEDGERKEEVTYVDVTLWARLAEISGEYLKKGKPVFIEGRLQLDTWDDKQTGQKRSRLRVIAESMQLLGARDNGGRPAERTQGAAAGSTQPPRQRDPDLDAEPDDIPF
jgi:single-strand DNA-binding protein